MSRQIVAVIWDLPRAYGLWMRAGLLSEHDLDGAAGTERPDNPCGRTLPGFS